MQSVGIVMAMQVEAASLLQQLQRATHRPAVGLQISEGYIGRAHVVLTVAGIGKVAAALGTQRLCDSYHLRGLIVAGLAGRLVPQLSRGTIVVANESAQHDFDARPFAHTIGLLPHLNVDAFQCDPQILNAEVEATLALSRDSPPSPAVTGLVVSGDHIIRSRQEQRRILRWRPDALCVDMETAAVAQVATQNATPWGAVRIISDDADESLDVSEVLAYTQHQAAVALASVLVHTVEAL